MGRWYLLITENFLFWSFQRWEIRSFLSQKNWWKDDIYLVFFSFLWYSRTWEIWFFYAVEFVNLAENWFGLTIKIKQLNLKKQTVKHLRLENGDEYISNDFEEFCNNHGNQHELISTYRNSQIYPWNLSGNCSTNAESRSKNTLVLGWSCLYCMLHMKPKANHIFKECYTLWILVW